MRKTIDRAEVLKAVNHFLGLPLDVVDTDAKSCFCSMIENLLMKNEMYRGFSFSRSDSVPGDVDYYNRFYY